MELINRTMADYHLGVIFTMAPLLLIAAVFLLNLKRSQLLFSVFFSRSFFYEHATESLFGAKIYNIIVLLMLIVLQSIIVFFTFIQLGIEKSYFLLSSIAFYISVYQLSIVLIRILMIYLSIDKSYFKLMFKVCISTILNLSVILTLLISILFYSDLSHEVKSNIFYVFFIILYLYRFMVIVLNNKKLISKPFFLIILYLCTLEIIPIVCIYSSIKA